MGRYLRKSVHFGYIHCIKPVLFRFHPDNVHAKTVAFGKRIKRSNAALVLTSKSLACKNPVLEQTLHGLHFPNPVGLSAGFDKSVELVPLVEAIGFGFITTGSVTGKACEGNAKPWFHRLPKEKSLVVNVGLANQGSAAVADRLQSDKQTADRKVPLMISVARTNDQLSSNDEQAIEDYCLGLRNLKDYPELFELNISCPNTFGGEPFTDPARLDKLLTAIDHLRLAQPVFVKMPSNKPWEDLDALLAVTARHSIQGVTVCNLRKDRRGVTVDASIKGNLSGKPVQEMSDELIEKTYKAYGKKLTIIGVGGIFTAEDAYRKIKRGASVVALITGMIYEGPSIVGDINDGLVELLKKDGYTNISQAVGAGVQ